MRINRHTTIFFDASVLVAGAHSPQGGSALLLSACRAKGFRARATSAVLLECLHTLDEFPEASQNRFQYWLMEIDWEFVSVPSEGTIARYEEIIDPKDAHVLAAAVESGSDFLLTLDRRHILASADAVRQAHLQIAILRPGDFIREYYPLHRAYSSLPPARTQDRHKP